MKKVLTRLIPLLLLVLTLGCSKPPAFGDMFRVAIFADDDTWKKVQPAVEEVFNARWITPQDERQIEFLRADPAELQEFFNRRDLLLIMCGEAEGPVGEFLQQALSSDVRSRIQREEGFLFKRDDAFARGQRVVICAAPNLLSFLTQFKARGDEIRGLFIEHNRQVQAEYLWREEASQECADSLFNSSGLSLRVPQEWFVVQDSAEPRFLRLRALSPDRWITVHWVDGDDSLRGSEDGLREVRQRLGRAYWDKDYSEKDWGRFSACELAGHPAQLFEGLWGTDEYLGGGPFLFWSLYMPAEGERPARTYYIDAAVLNPAGPKSPLLHQLSTLVNTLQVQPLNEE